MPDKTKWDLISENFNFFFHKLTATMTDQQKDVLPKDLYFKLFKTGGKHNTKDTTKLSFLAKLYILIKSFKKRVIIIVEDDKEGMDEEQYFKYKKQLHKRQYTVSGASDLIEDATFVLGNKELIDTYSALNGLSTSGAYNYLIKSKNAVTLKPDEQVRAMQYVARFLTNYESARKRIHMNSGLNINEWLVLIALFHGEEMQGAKIYQEVYKHSFNSSAHKKRTAFCTLEVSKYIEKIGKSKGMKLKITALGRLKVLEVLSKYAVNC